MIFLKSHSIWDFLYSVTDSQKYVMFFDIAETIINVNIACSCWSEIISHAWVWKWYALFYILTEKCMDQFLISEEINFETVLES